MTEQEELLKKYEDVPFDILTIVDGMRVLKSIVNDKPCVYVYPQKLYEIKNAEYALQQQVLEAQKKVNSYDLKAAYHAELMERFFNNSNPMTDPDAADKFKRIGVEMKERFGDD